VRAELTTVGCRGGFPSDGWRSGRTGSGGANALGSRATIPKPCEINSSTLARERDPTRATASSAAQQRQNGLRHQHAGIGNYAFPMPALASRI
jgi:hypothetical protein